MRVENTTDQLVKVGGLNIAPGMIGTVADDAVIPPGFRKLPDLPRVPSEHEKLVRCIRFNRAGPRGLALTVRGRPRCKPLERALGRTVSAAQRDRAWREVQAKRAHDGLSAV